MKNKKIRVVVILSSFCVGGAENMVYELTKSFDKNEVECIVISCCSREGSILEKKVDDAKINVYYGNCQGNITILKLVDIYKHISSFKPDIIHAHMGGVIYSLPYVLTHNIKLVVTAHTTPKEAFNNRTTNILKFLAKRNKVILTAVSEENKRLMADYYGIDRDKVEYVNNGVDLTRYYRKNHTRLTFVNVGRMDKNKNQQLIINLFNRLDVARCMDLILCGDGPERPVLEKMVETLGLKERVTFTGNVGNVQDYLAVSDIYIQTSHREGLPLSTIEAIATKLPVISTNVGGMKNIVKDNGFLINDGDEEGLFNAMKSLSTDTSLREKMGEKSYEIANLFSAESMSAKYTSIYKKWVRN